LIAQLHAQSVLRGRDRKVVIAEATDQIERFARRLLVRQSQRILRH
jgi:hypothetical protein